MKRMVTAAIVIAASMFVGTADRPATQSQPQPLRIIAFGAHPDDAELKASGVAALSAAAGHKVKFVAATSSTQRAFQLGQYGHQASLDELKRMFLTFEGR